MRCYHFCNMYLGGLQAGLQSAHTQHELALKYLAGDRTGTAACGYLEWAQLHKTVILLNGGMAKQLLELEAFLTENDHGYAWASFREEQDAINGAITNVGIVLPERMYAISRPLMRAIELNKSGSRCEISHDGDDGYLIYRGAGTEPDGARYIVEFVDGDGHAWAWRYTSFDIQLIERMQRCNLMS